MPEFVDVAGEGEIRELEAYEVGGRSVAVANVDGSLHAFDDTCTHMACSLAEGDLEGTTVICPCHGSEFDVTTGEVLQGPATQPVESFPVRVVDGRVQIAV